MRNRPFYLLTCVLAMAAVVVTGASKQYAGRAAQAAAGAAAANSPEEREALHSAADRYAEQSGRLSVVAIGVLVLAIAGWVCSRLRRERGLQSIPLLLVCLAVLLQFLAV